MCGNPKREACHQETFGHRHYLYFAALLIFMRRTSPFEPLEPIEPAPPLSNVIKGQHAHGLSPNLYIQQKESIYEPYK